MNQGYKLLNGQARARKLSTFEMPSKEDVDALKPGDYVKIGIEGDMGGGCSGERFWVRLTKIEAGDYTGVVEQSDMLFADKHGVAHDSIITFDRRHILGITIKCEACGDKGILLNQHAEIERCDACEKYESDWHAWMAAKPEERVNEARVAEEGDEQTTMIYVTLSDALSVVRDSDHARSLTKEEIAATWADAIEQKSEILGGLSKYIMQFMDSYRAKRQTQ